jgi:hypothetical protein
MGSRGRPFEVNHCSNGIELSIRFALWMQEQRTTPEWQRIAIVFRVSRATAYRWLRAYLDATSQPLPTGGKRSATPASQNRKPE